MRQLISAACLVVAVAMAPMAAAQTSPAPAAAPISTPAGVGVIALAGASDAAWPLARALYAEPSVRASGIDEAHARVLCGEPPTPGAPQELRDLAATIGAVRGDDAPSRAILAEIARRFSVRGLVLVGVDGMHPSARVFQAAAGTFDPATYEPDAGASLSWSAAARLIVQSFGSAATPLAAPAFATHEEPIIQNSPPRPRHFYESGWFWGALAAAAFGGGAIYLATRDNGSQTIHLQAEIPH